MRNTGLKFVIPKVVKPLIEALVPNPPKDSRNDETQAIREHILLGRPSPSVNDEFTETPDSLAPNEDREFNFRPVEVMEFDGARGTEQAKPLDLSDGVIHAVFDPQKNYIIGTIGHDIMHATEGDDVVFGLDGHDDIQLSDGHDTARGGNGEDQIWGQNGHDRLYGGSDDDGLFGGHGKDWLFGEEGNDRLFGNDGRDILVGGDGQDEMHGGAGNDQMHGGTGNDQMHGDAGNDLLRGSSGNDVLFGGHGDDTLAGEIGHDDLRGEGGNDVLEGGFGIDILNGGAGDDLLHGGANDNATPWGDYLTGGQGNDMFWFNFGDSGGDTSEDVIWDFESGADTLVFQILTDANFLGESGGFSGQAGAEAWFEHVIDDGFGAVTRVHVRDADGLDSDIDVMLQGHIDLTSDDLVFG